MLAMYGVSLDEDTHTETEFYKLWDISTSYKPPPLLKQNKRAQSLKNSASNKDDDEDDSEEMEFREDFSELYECEYCSRDSKCFYHVGAGNQTPELALELYNKIKTDQDPDVELEEMEKIVGICENFVGNDDKRNELVWNPFLEDLLKTYVRDGHHMMLMQRVASSHYVMQDFPTESQERINLLNKIRKMKMTTVDYVVEQNNTIRKLEQNGSAAYIAEKIDIMKQLASDVRKDHFFTVPYVTTVCAGTRQFEDAADRLKHFRKTLLLDDHIAVMRFIDHLLDLDIRAKEEANQLSALLNDTEIKEKLPIFSEIQNPSCNNCYQIALVHSIMKKSGTDINFSSETVVPRKTKFVFPNEELRAIDVAEAVVNLTIFGQLKGNISRNNPFCQWTIQRLNDFMLANFKEGDIDLIESKLVTLMITDMGVINDFREATIKEMRLEYTWTESAISLNLHDGAYEEEYLPPNFPFSVKVFNRMMNGVRGIMSPSGFSCKVVDMDVDAGFLLYELHKLGYVNITSRCDGIERGIIYNQFGDVLLKNYDPNAPDVMGRKMYLGKVRNKIMDILLSGYTSCLAEECFLQGRKRKVCDEIFPYVNLCEQLDVRHEIEKAKSESAETKEVKESLLEAKLITNTSTKSEIMKMMMVYTVMIACEEENVLIRIYDEEGELADIEELNDPFNLEPEAFKKAIKDVKRYISTPQIPLYAIVAKGEELSGIQALLVKNDVYLSLTVAPPSHMIFPQAHLYSEDEWLDRACHIGYLHLHSPITSGCNLLKYDPYCDGVTGFSKISFGAFEELIPTREFRRLFCVCLRYFVSIERVNCSDIITRVFSRCKLEFLYGRTPSFHYVMGKLLDMLQDWDQLPDRIQSVEDFLCFLLFTRPELEVVSPFFVGGNLLPTRLDKLCHDSFMNQSFKQVLFQKFQEHIDMTITEADAAEIISSDPNAWPDWLKEIDSSVELQKRLNGDEIRNLEHPIFRKEYRIRSSYFDMTLTFGPKFLVTHTFPKKLIEYIWMAFPMEAQKTLLPAVADIPTRIDRDFLCTCQRALCIIVLARFFSGYVSKCDHLPFIFLFWKAKNTILYSDPEMEELVSKLSCFRCLKKDILNGEAKHSATFRTMCETLCHIFMDVSRTGLERKRVNTLKTDVKNGFNFTKVNLHNCVPYQFDSDEIGLRSIDDEFIVFGIHPQLNFLPGHVEQSDKISKGQPIKKTSGPPKRAGSDSSSSASGSQRSSLSNKTSPAQKPGTSTKTMMSPPAAPSSNKPSAKKPRKGGDKK